MIISCGREVHQKESANMTTTDVPSIGQQRSRGSSRTGSVISSRGGSSFIAHPFGFDSKTSYDANHSVLNLRSANYYMKNPIVDDDIWKKPPPDFRPQCYVPNPPKRNSREAVNPWKYGTVPGEKPMKRPAASLKLPHILQMQTDDDEENFITACKVPGAWEGKLMFAKEGMYKPGPYRMPKPHDFRGYPSIASLGLPEFTTDRDRDPFNIRFLSHNLDILPGDGPAVREERQIKGQQMAPPMTPQLHWDSRLILPHENFPNKYRAYTRFRPMDRSVHSALMDRVEEKLGAQWAKAQLDRQVTLHSFKTRPKPSSENEIASNDCHALTSTDDNTLDDSLENGEGCDS